MDLSVVDAFEEAINNENTDRIREIVKQHESIPLCTVRPAILEAFDNQDCETAKLLLRCLSVSEHGNDEGGFIDELLTTALGRDMDDLAQWILTNDDLGLSDPTTIYKQALKNNNDDVAAFVVENADANDEKVLKNLLLASVYTTNNSKKHVETIVDRLTINKDDGYTGQEWRVKRLFGDVICTLPSKHVEAPLKYLERVFDGTLTELFTETTGITGRYSNIDIDEVKPGNFGAFANVLDVGKEEEELLGSLLYKVTKFDVEPGYIRDIEMLIQNGAPIDSGADKFRSTPIYRAAQHDNKAYVETLMEFDPPLNTNSKAFIRDVVRMNDPDLIDTVVNEGFDINADAFYAACRADNEIFHTIYNAYEPRIDVAHNAVLHILETGSPDEHLGNLQDLIELEDIEDDRFKDSVINAATKSGHPDWIRLLVAAGYDVGNAQDELVYAIENENKAMVNVLLAHGALAAGEPMELAEEKDDRTYADDCTEWQDLLTDKAPDNQSAALMV